MICSKAFCMICHLVFVWCTMTGNGFVVSGTICPGRSVCGLQRAYSMLCLILHVCPGQSVLIAADT